MLEPKNLESKSLVAPTRAIPISPGRNRSASEEKMTSSTKIALQHLPSHSFDSSESVSLRGRGSSTPSSPGAKTTDDEAERSEEAEEPEEKESTDREEDDREEWTVPHEMEKLKKLLREANETSIPLRQFQSLDQGPYFDIAESKKKSFIFGFKKKSEIKAEEETLKSLKDHAEIYKDFHFEVIELLIGLIDYTKALHPDYLEKNSTYKQELEGLLRNSIKSIDDGLRLVTAKIFSELDAEQLLPACKVVESRKTLKRCKKTLAKYRKSKESDKKIAAIKGEIKECKLSLKEASLEVKKNAKLLGKMTQIYHNIYDFVIFFILQAGSPEGCKERIRAVLHLIQLENNNFFFISAVANALGSDYIGETNFSIVWKRLYDDKKYRDEIEEWEFIKEHLLNTRNIHRAFRQLMQKSQQSIICTIPFLPPFLTKLNCFKEESHLPSQKKSIKITHWIQGLIDQAKIYCQHKYPTTNISIEQILGWHKQSIKPSQYKGMRDAIVLFYEEKITINPLLALAGTKGMDKNAMRRTLRGKHHTFNLPPKKRKDDEGGAHSD